MIPAEAVEAAARKPLWLRALDREKMRGLREVLTITSDIIPPKVARIIQRNITRYANPALIHKGRKP